MNREGNDNRKDIYQMALQTTLLKINENVYYQTLWGTLLMNGLPTAL